MALPQGRRELKPSREATGRRRGPSLGSKLNVSVPLSIGLPLVVVGLFLFVTGVTAERGLFLVIGGVIAAVGLALFASGKRL